MIETELKDNTLTARLSGELDHDSAARMRKKIDALLQAHRPRLLCLDFSGVSFMDSSGVGLVMGRYRAASLAGAKLRVINVPDNIYRIFAMSGLEALGVIR